MLSVTGPSGWSRPAILLGSLIVSLLGILGWAFGTWTATSPWSFPLFVVIAGLVVAIPGLFLVDAGGSGARGLERWALALCLGMVASTMLYAVCASAHLRPLFLVWPAASLVWLARRQPRRALLVPVPRWAPALAGLVAVSLAPVLFLPDYTRNLALTARGGMTFSPEPDVILHASLAQELTHTVPPSTPFLPGMPLHYHYGMDLFTAVFHGVGGLSIPDLCVRFVPVLLVTTTALAAFCLSRAWLGAPWAALLAGALMLFGEDFSYVPGILQGKQYWAATIFHMPTVVSLYSLNPMLPALGLLCASLLCLHRYCESGRVSWLAFTALSCAGLAECKVFAGAHLLAAMGMAGVYRLGRWRDARLLKALAASVSAVVPFAAWGLQAERGQVTVAWHPPTYVAGWAGGLGPWGESAAVAAIRAYAEGGRELSHVVAFWVIGVGVYLAGTLGMRLLALPAIVRDPERSEWRPVRQVVTAFLLLGPLLSLTLIVVPTGYGLESQYNNGVWFLVQSKYLLWLFAVEFLWRATSGNEGRRRLVAVMTLALSLPSAVEFFVIQVRGNRLRPLHANLMDVVRVLQTEAAPGAVVLGRRGPLAPILCTTTCRGPVLTIHPAVHLAPEELEAWRTELRSFWRGWSRGTLHEATLSRLHVAYVLVDRESDESPGAWHLRATEGEAFRLVPRAENRDYALYRVLPR